MGTVVAFHGRGTSAGQGVSAGQLSENQRNVRSRRPTVIPAPPSIARSFLPSRKTRELTVETVNRLLSAYARATVSSPSVPDMTPLWVRLPDKSMGLLPRAHDHLFGYFTEMELKDILAWIDARKEATGLSDLQASKKAGHPYVIQNMRKTLRNGHGSRPKVETLKDLAKVLGEPPAALFDSTAIGEDLETVLETRLAALEAEAERVRTTLQVIRETKQAS